MVCFKRALMIPDVHSENLSCLLLPSRYWGGGICLKFDHQLVVFVNYLQTKRSDPPESFKNSMYDIYIRTMFLGCANLSTAPIFQRHISKKIAKFMYS